MINLDDFVPVSEDMPPRKALQIPVCRRGDSA